jgi:excisionase family DNA binding protein
MATHDTPRLLRRSEVADLLGVSRRTLDRLAQAGAIPVVYIDRRPRYLAEDVATFVRERRTAAPGTRSARTIRPIDTTNAPARRDCDGHQGKRNTHCTQADQ